MKNRDFLTVQSSKQIEKKVIKKTKKQWVVKGLLFSTILGSSLLLSNVETFAQETQKEWIPRTSEQIKSEIKDNEYVIQWGDTLSAISIATDISINRLAEINEITNIDLIYAGNKLVFGGGINSKTGEDNRVVAIQDNNNKTTDVINTDDNKPLVNQKETNKAKEIESIGGNYTPPKTGNSGTNPLPDVPTVPTKPKPEETLPPVKPVDPIKPTDPEPPVKPIEPTEPEENEVDKSQLISLFNSTTNYVSTDYEEQSWTIFSNSRNEAKIVIDNPKATGEEVLTATTNLQNGINQLSPIEQPVIVDKTALTDLYNSTIDYVSTDYETNSWDYFKEVREEAYNTISNPDTTQEQVNAMTVNLENAINQLIPISIEETDKTALFDLVEEVKNYEPTDYTEESWNNFYQAFSVAIDVLADEQANQESIDLAFNNLTLAVSSLEEVKESIVNKDELTKLYNDSASLNSDDYTEKSWNDYILVRSDVKAILDDEQANQQDVDNASVSLQKAIDNLEKVVIADKSKLIKLYDSTASLNPDDYTEESWNNFILAKSDSKSVIDNPKASQNEIDNSYNQLNSAKNNLEKKNNNWDNLELGVPTYSAEMTEKFENAINDYRQAHGVFTLPVSNEARERSNATASKNVSSDWTAWTASHGGQQVGTTWGSTTFYSETDAIQKAMTNFDNSPGHKANLLEDDPDFAESVGGSVYIMKSIDKTTGATMYSYLFIGTFYSWLS